jgi:hypothetical protein
MLQKNSGAIGLANEPIGILPNGTINVVKIDDPPFEPTVYDDRGVRLPEPDSGVRQQTGRSVCGAGANPQFCAYPFSRLSRTLGKADHRGM